MRAFLLAFLFVPLVSGQLVFVRNKKAAGGGGYSANATVFDGTNDYMEYEGGGSLTGLSDGDLFTCSFWIDFKGGNATTQTIFYIGNNDDPKVRIIKNTSNQINVFGETGGGTTQVDMTSTGTLTDASGWTHVFIVVDTSTEANCKIYLDGVQGETHATTSNSFDIDMAQDDNLVGADNDASDKLNAELSEFWFDNQYDDTYTDWNDGGSPKDVGSDGSTPTGTAPAVYLPNAFGTFQNNAGLGENFTVTGAFTEGTPP